LHCISKPKDSCQPKLNDHFVIKKFFQEVKTEVKENRLLPVTLKPIQVMIDFEIAAKKAFEKVFIGILVKGCLFHFGQSLFRKFVSLGLKTYYIEKKDVQDWFKSIFCLALLPITSVEQEFELLSIQMTQVVSRNFGTQSRSKGLTLMKIS
jgi:hypothetical protein